MAKIISAFATMGKTTLAQKDEHIVDLDSSAFSWVEKEEFLEDGTPVKYKERNPNFAEDYYAEIEKLLKDENVDLVLISTHEQIRRKLTKEGVEFYTVVPTENSKEAVLRRMKERGNDEKFIKMIDETFEDAMKSVMKTTPQRDGWGGLKYLRLVEFDLEKFPNIGLASDFTELAKESLSKDGFLVYEFSLESYYNKAKTPTDKALFLLNDYLSLYDSPSDLGSSYLDIPIEDEVTERGRWSVYGTRIYRHHSDPNRFLAEYYDDPATEMQERGESSFREVQKKIELREIVTYV